MTPFGKAVSTCIVAALALAALVIALLLLPARTEQPHQPPGMAGPGQTGVPAGEPPAPHVPDATRSIRVDGREIIVGARDRVVFEHKDEVTDVGGGTRSERQAATTGVGLTTSADSVAQTFKAEAANTQLDGVGAAAGGGFSYSGKMTGGASLNVFHAIGAACLLGALGFVVVPLFLKLPPRWGTAAALAGGGVGFVAIGASVEAMPWAWALGGLLILLGLGFWLFMAVRSGSLAKALGSDTARKADALEAFVTAVSRMPAEDAAKVKAAMNTVLGAWTPAERSAVETEVQAAKARLGL